MRGSDFIISQEGKSLVQWEGEVTRDPSNLLVPWPTFPVTVQAIGHTGTFFASADYLAVGEPDDYVRMPLTPIAAQQVADSFGMMLPTPKMVKDIWAASNVQLNPIPATALPPPLNVNRGADLHQYTVHSQAIDNQLLEVGGGIMPYAMVSGQKKDIVVGKLLVPGKVVIFGWLQKDGTPIQPRTNVHGDFYVDYSHGIRLISPVMIVDGQSKSTSDVLSDPILSALVSDEGPISEKQQRYPTKRGAVALGLFSLTNFAA